jgi:hypothetical protein
MNDKELLDFIAHLSFPLGLAVSNIMKAGSTGGEEGQLLIDEAIVSLNHEMHQRTLKIKEAEKAAKKAEKEKEQMSAKKRGPKKKDAPAEVAPKAPTPIKAVDPKPAKAVTPKAKVVVEEDLVDLSEDDELEEDLATQQPADQQDLM